MDETFRGNKNTEDRSGFQTHGVIEKPWLYTWECVWSAGKVSGNFRHFNPLGALRLGWNRKLFWRKIWQRRSQSTKRSQIVCKTHTRCSQTWHWTDSNGGNCEFKRNLSRRHNSWVAFWINWLSNRRCERNEKPAARSDHVSLIAQITFGLRQQKRRDWAFNFPPLSSGQAHYT